MLFHSQIFLLGFLPITLLVFWRVARYPSLRGWWLVLASLVFYGWWEPRLLPLLAGSILGNWLLAGWWTRHRHARVITLGVTLNLLLLGVFKYADFTAHSLASLAGATHAGWDIVLPLGISFFTFQQIAYLVDLRRGVASRYPLRDYALFVSFFPQLIAGPIVRHGELVPQFARSPLHDGAFEHAGRGLVLLMCGLFKKVVVADDLARVVDPVFAAAAAGSAPGAIEAWLATLGFGLQIYFDFSGYSDMAIGLALLFGLKLPVNFSAPYRASSLRGFWHRWHITLSTFLRDYLYIPLGGNRHGRARQVMALLATMLLGGLWHGAAWTFVAWGALHGAGLALAHAWRVAGLRMPAVAGWSLTMAFVFATWVPFRAADFGSAWLIYQGLVGLHGAGALPQDPRLASFALAGALALLGPTSQVLALERLRPTRTLAVALGLVLAALMVYIGGERTPEFIYFQF